jgi:hypothetical protein
MYDIKIIVGLITVILTFVGYVPYLRDTVKGKTKPHVYSWFIWGFITLLIFTLQFSGQAGAGSFTTFAAGLICLVIFAFAFRNGNKDITRMDTVFFILAILATVIWIFAKQPVISVVLLSAIDMLGFVPTIRKSWNKPYSETLFTYALNTFRFVLTIYALQVYTIVTSLYPITWVIANGSFSVMLIIRRRYVSKKR